MKNNPLLIRVSIDDQRLQLIEAGRVVMDVAVATASNGPGERIHSECTPRGRHRIRARIGDGWIPPISVSTPDALASKLEQIRSHRREVGRASQPFSVYWTLQTPFDPREHEDWTRLGVTHVFTSPWRFDEADVLSVDEKCARIERFGREVLSLPPR